MQTFMPYADFEAAVGCLDSRRLGKQRVEAYQILRALRGESKGWTRHPATLMWRGYEPALGQYLRASILEWVRRGYRNTMTIPDIESCKMPWWLTDPKLHISHRSNLLRKSSEYYSKFCWDVSDDIPYWWPVAS